MGRAELVEQELKSPERGSGRWEFVVRTIIAVGIATLLAVAVFLLWYVRHILLLAFAGVLLAVFLQTLSQWLHRVTRLRYGICLAVVVVVLAAVIGALGWLAGSPIARQVGELSEAFRSSLEQLRQQLQKSPWGQRAVQNLSQSGQAVSGGEVLSQAAGIASSVAHAIIAPIVVIFVGLYVAAQPGFYLGGLVRLVPPNRRARATEVIDRVGDTLRWWLLAQLFAMTLVGTLTGLGLWLVGSRLPFALGLVAFGFQIIPNVGPFLSAIPAVLLAWTDSPMKAVYVILVFIVVHLIEGYVLTPLVQSRAIHLPPALHVVSVLILAELAGLLGVLVSAPLVVILMVLIQCLYVEDVLGDRPPRQA